jgi:hypothetical protein
LRMPNRNTFFARFLESPHFTKIWNLMDTPGPTRDYWVKNGANRTSGLGEVITNIKRISLFSCIDGIV